MQMLASKWDEGKFACVGLDSAYLRLPECVRQGRTYEEGWRSVVEFNHQIVLHTRDLVCAYKPNIAFYPGPSGLMALAATIEMIKMEAPDVPVILDAKRADIDSTNEGYVAEAFDYNQADAITVHNYMGAVAMAPFLDCENKGIFVLCRTSNKGAEEFQDLIQQDGRPLYQHIAEDVATVWNRNGNCGVVVGATAPSQLSAVRSIVGEMPILIPGIGAQGGDLEATVKAGKDKNGRGMIINSSRGIIFASKGEDYPEAARRETQKLHAQIKACLNS